jgi:hypothetical protein
MVYVGGTDPGRFIPTLLNDTSDGDQHIILTQNALADSSYVQYVNFLYGDQMNGLSTDDSQQAFQNYMDDAKQRALHDQQTPDGPRQVAPGEDVTLTDDGQVRVSGQVSVMAINEKLFQMILDKNPDASFALEESFPFKSTYAQAVPLGPVMQLRVADAQNAFTADAAAQAVDYWNNAAQQLLDAPEAGDDPAPLQAYSKLAVSQAHLLADHSYTADAEQAYEIALQLCPASPEAVFGYVNMLLTQNRAADAMPVVQNAVQAAPDNQQLRDLLNNLTKIGR